MSIAATRSPAARGRKQDRVYRAVRDRILSGDLPPGSRLRTDEIGRDLEVSHIPVREALKQLQAEGYVTVEPFVGAKVADLPVEWIEEVFELKESLELLGGRAACRSSGEEELAAIREIVRRMDGLTDDPEAWSRANVELHRLICTAGGKELTGRMLGRVMDQWDLLRRRYLEEVSAQRLAQAQVEHRAIFEALELRDEEKLASLIRGHNRAARSAYLRHLGLE